MARQTLVERPFRAFLSHARLDKQNVVDTINDWCKEKAALRVWYDTENLAHGLLGNEISRAMANCQAAIIAVSKASVESRWVNRELNLAMKQQDRFPGFQIIPLRIDDCECPPEMDIMRAVHLEEGQFTAKAATQLIEALYWHESDPVSLYLRPIYLALSWRRDSAKWANTIISWLKSKDLRVVGDAPDQTTMKREPDRIPKMVASCSGLVAILPNRQNGRTSPYILREIAIALEKDIATLVILEPGLDWDKLSTSEELHGVKAKLGKLVCVRANECFSVNSGAQNNGSHELTSSKAEELEAFAEDLGRPRRPAYCFYGYGFKSDIDRRKYIHPLGRRVIEAVTAMPCIVGDDIIGAQIQEEIVERIKAATFCIFDISDAPGLLTSTAAEEIVAQNGLKDGASPDRRSFLLNTCIEAGIALGAGVPFVLLARGQRTSPPFMFRGQQVLYYTSELDFVGQVHKACLKFRRRIY